MIGKLTMMMRRISIAAATATMLVAPAYADPQQRVPHIDVLFGDRNNASWTQGLRDGLRRLGFVEFLHELAPRATRIAFLRNPDNRLAQRLLDELQAAGKPLGMQITTLDARDANEVDSALHSLRRSAPQALIVSAEPLFVANKVQIARVVRTSKLPAIFPWREYHDERVLMSYGPNLRSIGTQMADYVDKILRGANPGELPIDQVSKYELILDLRVASELGLNVPQSLSARADEVIR